MKRIIIVLISIVLLVSCDASLKIKDEEGWEIFQCGWALSDNEVLIQSHDGYVLGDRIYNEHIDTIYKTDEEEKTIMIENPTDRQVDVKLTYSGNEKWIEIGANDSYLIEVACFQ